MDIFNSGKGILVCLGEVTVVKKTFVLVSVMFSQTFI